MTEQFDKTILGIDLGANSIGWAIAGFKNGQPAGIAGMGVRIFQAGSDGNIEEGRDESRAVQRRDARQRRRQTKRQSWRMMSLARALQKHGLLPEGDVKTGKSRHELLVQLDQELRAAFMAQGIPGNTSNGLRELPYFLRARALDHSLEPFALGRAIYHLAQRRGFLSNRKSDRDEKELGVVKQSISELEQAMNACGVRTLGEFFHRLDPVIEKRIRKRWTARSMYDAEFEKIWSAQAQHNPALCNADAKKHLHDLIFNQRPLKSQAGLVGPCELEPGKKRAPKAILPAQRFRILQKVNDLRLCFEDGTSRELTPEEKKLLADHMDTVREITFPGLRKLLGIKKSECVEFNLERGGEKKLKGNTTAAPLRDVFGDRWDVLPADRKNAIIGELMGIENTETIKRRGVEVWGLTPDAADALAKVKLEDGFCALSREALKKLLPLMEQGVAFKTAEDQVYGQSSWVKHTCDRLMPVADSGIAVRNPVVMRCLTELRKVVNAILRKYGKPDEIHIELARELKKSREDRMRISKDNRKRQDTRDTGYETIQKRTGIPNPKREDVEKYLLAVECAWICPYTGRSIGFDNLFGDHPQFDVEHIIPFSRSLDDSFMNKTLCYHEENRSIKGNKTPWEAYEHSGKWEEIVGRVQRFNGDAAQQKLERFQTRDVKDFEDVSSTKLNDTRYASKLAARYLGWLYGAEYRSRIQTNTGQITAYLRSAWRLNGILGAGEVKTRDDHRHHAVDALVIALTTRSAVKQLSDAAQKQHRMKGRTRGFGKLVEQPWDSFLEDTRASVEAILVSHRVDHRVSGRLHEETFYSRPRTDENGKNYHVVRKPLGEMFSEADIDQIVDLAVRDAVREHFEASGRNAKKAFGNPANHPMLRNNGSSTPIHRVRIRRGVTTFPVGQDKEPRYVTPDSNHHMEVLEKQRNKKAFWYGAIVDLFEAAQRMRSGQSVVNKNHGEGTRFLFTVSSGEVFRVKEGESHSYFIARTIWGSNVEYVSVTDSRRKADIKASDCWYFRSIDKLRELGFEKVVVSPLGEPIVAHD